MTKIKISDLIDKNIILEHKDGNYGSLYPRKSEFGEEGIPFLTAKLIDNSGRIFFDRAERLNEEKANEFSFGWIQEDDVLLSHNATIGRVTVVPKIKERMLVGTSLTYYRLDKNKLLPSYFATYLSSKEFQNQLRAVMSYSTRDQVPITIQRDLFIEVPDFSTQLVIGNIYSNFSRKIELNRKTNETLEEIAKALFKSWFIDFDPVKAKAEGRSTGLLDEFSDLFPDSFEDSELGEIPKGWEVKKLGEIIELAYGKPLKESERIKGAFAVFGSNGKVGTHEDYLVKGPGIVVGRKGKPGIVKWSDDNFFPIDTTFYVKPKSEIAKMTFLFFILSNQKLSNLSADSVVPGLNRNIAYMNQQVIPSYDVIALFEEQVRDLFLRKKINNSESSLLQNLRDSLLPKLISGELRIPDAEKIIEEVGI